MDVELAPKYGRTGPLSQEDHNGLVVSKAAAAVTARYVAFPNHIQYTVTAGVSHQRRECKSALECSMLAMVDSGRAHNGLVAAIATEVIDNFAERQGAAKKQEVQGI